MSELILDPRSTAVVVIDIQKGIVGRPGAPHPTASVVANCVRLVEAARRAGAQPVLVHVGGARDGADRVRPTVFRPYGWQNILCIGHPQLVLRATVLPA